MDKENNMNIGAIFCQNDNIKQISQLEFFITEGNHWWNGTTASFMKIPIIINSSGFNDVEETPPSRINKEPKAWGKKYLIGASL